jgi:hypothetical protein
MKDLENLIIRLHKDIIKKSPYIKTIRDPKLLIKSLTELNELIGNAKIKESIAMQISHLIVKKKRGKDNSNVMLNSILYGPPGVGKTHISTKLAKIWYALGYLKGYKNNNPLNMQDLFKNGNNDEELATMMIAGAFIVLLWVIGLTWNFYSSYGALLTVILIITLIAVFIFVALYYKNTPKDKKENFDLSKYFNDDEVVKVVSRVDMVGPYVGSTAIKTTKLLEESLGKVLFIDEAYSILQSPEDSFGMEALTTLNLFLSNHPNEILVIFAGYKDLLESGPFAAQPGLKRRFMWHFDCDGYSIDELYEIFKFKLHQEKFKVKDDDEILALFKHYDCFPNYGGDIEKLIFFTDLEHSKDYIHDESDMDLDTFTPDQIKRGLVKLMGNNIDSRKEQSGNPMANVMNMFRKRRAYDDLSSQLFETKPN